MNNNENNRANCNCNCNGSDGSIIREFLQDRKNHNYPRYTINLINPTGSSGPIGPTAIV